MEGRRQRRSPAQRTYGHPRCRVGPGRTGPDHLATAKRGVGLDLRRCPFRFLRTEPGSPEGERARRTAPRLSEWRDRLEVYLNMSLDRRMGRGRNESHHPSRMPLMAVGARLGIPHTPRPTPADTPPPPHTHFVFHRHHPTLASSFSHRHRIMEHHPSRFPRLALSPSGRPCSQHPPDPDWTPAAGSVNLRARTTAVVDPGRPVRES